MKQTALDCAIRGKNREIINLVVDAGGECLFEREALQKFLKEKNTPAESEDWKNEIEYTTFDFLDDKELECEEIFIELLTQGAITDEQREMLQIAARTHKNLEEHFYSGDIRMGFMGSYVWKSVLPVLGEIPGLMVTKRDRVSQWKGKLEESRSELQVVTNNIKALKEKQKKIQKEITVMEENIHQSEIVLASWNKFASEEYRMFTHIAPILSEMEENLADLVAKQVSTDPSGFAALTEISDRPKLSLVFNSIGLSAESISKLADLDGELFLSGNSSLCDIYDIGSFEERKDLSYSRHMLKLKKLPFTEHCKVCPVCYCDTPEKLFNFLQSRGMELLSLEVLERFCINGTRALRLDHSDLSDALHLDNEETKKEFSTITQLKRIHQESLLSSS